MEKVFDKPKENIPESDIPKIRITKESQPDKPARRFEVEFKGQKFEFVEIESAEPSTTLLVHLPGFGEDAKQSLEYMKGILRGCLSFIALFLVSVYT